MIGVEEFYTPDYAKEQKLIYLTQWCVEDELPTLYKFQDQVLKDSNRTALIVKNYNVYAVAVNRVAGYAKQV
jgi:hypothetical protein